MFLPTEAETLCRSWISSDNTLHVCTILWSTVDSKSTDKVSVMYLQASTSPSRQATVMWITSFYGASRAHFWYITRPGLVKFNLFVSLGPRGVISAGCLYLFRIGRVLKMPRRHGSCVWRPSRNPLIQIRLFGGPSPPSPPSPNNLPSTGPPVSCLLTNLLRLGVSGSWEGQEYVIALHRMPAHALKSRLMYPCLY